MKNKMVSRAWVPVQQIKTLIFRGQERKFPLVTAMKNLLLSLKVLVLVGLDSAQEYKIAVLAGHLCFF